MNILKKYKSSKESLPRPTLSRLCRIYGILEELQKNGVTVISSKEIGERIGVNSDNIRKDIGYLGESGTCGSGYDIHALKKNLDGTLGLGHERKACVVGLGNLGIALLNYTGMPPTGFRILAGFDTNINKLETITTDIPLYPSYDIADVVRREGIELAVMAVAGDMVQETARRLIEGGIKGIVNFSPVMLNPGKGGVFISNIDLMSEFRILSALFTLNDVSAKTKMTSDVKI